jgi:hypothetical protein
VKEDERDETKRTGGTMAYPRIVTQKRCAKSRRCSGVGNCFVLSDSCN